MIQAILMMLVVGGVLGLVLGIAGIYFTVEVDHRLETVTTMLPGYNCGACGFPGCSGLASAIVDGKAASASCKPAKPEQRERITTYMATGEDPFAKVEPQKA